MILIQVNIMLYATLVGITIAVFLLGVAVYTYDFYSVHGVKDWFLRLAMWLIGIGIVGSFVLNLLQVFTPIFR